MSLPASASRYSHRMTNSTAPDSIIGFLDLIFLAKQNLLRYQLTTTKTTNKPLAEYYISCKLLRLPESELFARFCHKKTSQIRRYCRFRPEELIRSWPQLPVFMPSGRIVTDNVDRIRSCRKKSSGFVVAKLP